MDDLRTSDSPHTDSRTESGETTNTGQPGPWTSVLYLARKEVRKRLIYQLVAVAVALGLGVVAAYLFGAVSESPSDGSPTAAVLNFVFLICIGVLHVTGAWYSGDLSNTRSAISSESHIAFLKTLPLTVGQIVAARALVAVCSVLILVSAFLGSFYAFSEPLGDGLGVGGLLLFTAFWIGCSLVFEAVGLFTELGLRGLPGFFVYLILIALSGGLMGGIGADGVNVVSWVVELTRSSAVAPVLTLLLGGVLIWLSWLATTWRLNRKGVGS